MVCDQGDKGELSWRISIGSQVKEEQAFTRGGVGERMTQALRTWCAKIWGRKEHEVLQINKQVGMHAVLPSRWNVARAAPRAGPAQALLAIRTVLHRAGAEHQKHC